MYTIRVFIKETPINIIVEHYDISLLCNHFESLKINFKVYSVDGAQFKQSDFGFGGFDCWMID